MMSDFGCMEDWDLQAVVGGSCGSEAFADIMMENSPSLFAPPLTFGGHHHQDELLINFTPADDDFFETKAPYFDDGLEGFYKPFYPPQSMMINSSATTPPTSISAPQEAKEHEREGKKQPPFDPNESNSSPKSCTTGDTDTAQTTKSKRGRRNQHKRVVQQVAADGLSNDMWAWRKYGQKPIKGSPYPRSYYRCSSLKGCPARKQVERSSSDPSIFIITYTSEHSHAYPTRRSALAGSTRTKPSLPKQPSAAAKGPKVPTIKDTVPSPKTPSMASLEDEVWQHVSIGTDQDVEQILEKTTTGSTNNFMPDLIFPDELFPSLEDFQGLLFD